MKIQAEWWPAIYSAIGGAIALGSAYMWRLLDSRRKRLAFRAQLSAILTTVHDTLSGNMTISDELTEVQISRLSSLAYSLDATYALDAIHLRSLCALPDDYAALRDAWRSEDRHDALADDDGLQGGQREYHERQANHYQAYGAQLQDSLMQRLSVLQNKVR